MAISYFGGKNKMAEWIYPFIPRTTKIYAEPFSGAFWVYMNIKGDYSHVDKIIYNDINKHMVNLYSCMKDYKRFLEEFDKAFEPGGDLHQKGSIEDYKIEMKELYYKYKHNKSEGNFLDNPTSERPNYKDAVIYAFLITSAFNACYPRAAGCSAFSKDKLKVNALLNKLKDPRYQNKFSNVTEFENLDFETIINKYDSEDTYFYLDPPYEDKDNKRLDWYGVGDENSFGRASHERLCKMLSKTKAKWSLSYYYFDELEEWLPKDKYRWEFKDYFRSSASFSDNKDIAGTEVLIMNYDMSEEEHKENSKNFKLNPLNKKNLTRKKVVKKVEPEVKKTKDEEDFEDFSGDKYRIDIKSLYDTLNPDIFSDNVRRSTYSKIIQIFNSRYNFNKNRTPQAIIGFDLISSLSEYGVYHKVSLDGIEHKFKNLQYYGSVATLNLYIDNNNNIIKGDELLFFDDDIELNKLYRKNKLSRIIG